MRHKGDFTGRSVLAIELGRLILLMDAQDVKDKAERIREAAQMQATRKVAEKQK